MFVEEKGLVQGSAMLEDAHLVLNSSSEALSWLLDTFIHMHTNTRMYSHTHNPLQIKIALQEN